MSSGSSKMAAGALGTTFSLLLLASAAQGVFKVTHNARVEAVAGQNVSLPCILDVADAKLISIEWKTGGAANEKLVVYTPRFGIHHFWSNVSIRIVKNRADEPVGTYLELGEVQVQDSGLFTCEVTTYPYGSERAETELLVEDFRVTCDADTVQVGAGENITVQCTSNSAGARYSWTKNKALVSEGASLELRRVTGADAGVYTLAVSAGEVTLRRKVVVLVWTSTPPTTPTKPPATPIATATATETETETIASTPTTTAAQGGTDAGTAAAETNATAESPSTPAGRDLTPFTTMPPALTSASGDNATDGSRESPHNITATAKSTPGSAATGNATLPPRTEEPGEEHGIMGNVTDSPGETSTVGTNVTVTDAGNTKGRSRLVFIIVPVLVLMVVVGVLYRRHLIRKRMDMPPPFKPPPPPVKYTAARQWDSQTFPVSRCNSTFG